MTVLGNLYTYNEGKPSGGALNSWTLTYDTENQLASATQNDSQIQNAAMTSIKCYYADGSLLYAETPFAVGRRL